MHVHDPYFMYMYVPVKAHFQIRTIFKYHYTCSYLQSSVKPLIDFGLEYKKRGGAMFDSSFAGPRLDTKLTQAAPHGGTAFKPYTHSNRNRHMRMPGHFSPLLQQLPFFDTNAYAWNVDCYMYIYLSILQARVCSCSLLFV